MRAFMNTGGFKKGQSGNPGGRPKVLADVVEAYRAESDANRRKLVAIRDSDKSSDGDRLRAIAMMEDRAWGKPIQAIIPRTKRCCSGIERNTSATRRLINRKSPVSSGIGTSVSFVIRR